MNATAASFFFLLFAGAIFSLFAVALAVALVFLLPSQGIATVIAGLVISMSFLFAGLFLSQPNIPVGWIGLYYAVPTSHMLRATLLDQFYCDSAQKSCPSITFVNAAGAQTSVNQYTYIATFLGLDPASPASPQKWAQLGWEALSIVVVLLIAILASRWIRYRTAVSVD